MRTRSCERQRSTAHPSYSTSNRNFLSPLIGSILNPSSKWVERSILLRFEGMLLSPVTRIKSIREDPLEVKREERALEAFNGTQRIARAPLMINTILVILKPYVLTEAQTLFRPIRQREPRIFV